MINFSSPTEQLFLGAALAIVGKFVWDRWLSKSARITADKCADIRATCKEGMLGEFQKFKYEAKALATDHDKKFLVGDDNFKNLGIRLDRTNSLLKALLTVQMEFCDKIPGVDCQELTRLLIDQGIDATSLSFRRGRGEKNGE